MAAPLPAVLNIAIDIFVTDVAATEVFDVIDVLFEGNLLGFFLLDDDGLSILPAFSRLSLDTEIVVPIPAV